MNRRYLDKVSSILMRLSSGKYVLKHVTKVAYKDRIGNRKDFHTLVIYDNDRSYKNMKSMESINLSFKSYLSLEEANSTNWSSKAKIQINEYNIHRIVKKLKKVKKWFKSKKNEELFYLENGILQLNKEMALEKKFKKIINCGFDIIIKIIPAVINDKESRYEGILVFINNEEKYFELTIDELDTLIYKLKKINLYEAGLMMCNYIGRPNKEDEEFICMSSSSTEKEIEYQQKQNLLLNKSDNALKESLGGYFK